MVTKAEAFAQQQEMLKKAGVDVAKYNEAIAGGSSVEAALKAGGWGGQTQPTSIGTSTAASVGTSATKSTVTQPKQETYTYDTKSGYYTTTPATSSSSSSNSANIWNNLSYENQQKALTENPQLKQYLDTKGLTQKSAPIDVSGANQYNVSTRPETPAPTKKETEWDYQSTDDTRIQEMIGNLDYYKRNVPSLFDSWESYSEFFLEGKPRSPEQAKIVEQYYWDYQKYKPYDNYTPEQIGVGLANGTIPSDYLDYLKQYEPMKYGDALNAMNAEKTKIENNASYESMVMNAGIGDGRGGEGYQGKEGGLKDYSIWAGVWQDTDDNGIDDRLEHLPSEKEVADVEEYNRLAAANQEIQNEMDDMLKEYQRQFPDASLATLRSIVSDHTYDLQQEMKRNSVRMTELQGNIKYLQNERIEQNKAGLNSINQLTKNLGMYYEYSAQGMSDLAQAQYAATNVTFDQADKGTYTQKQMALENVLTPIYQQYGDIIQRPQSQVINDVIAYAQEKGIGLEQAFNENFMNQLKAKPEYEAMQAAFSEPNLQTIGYDSNGKAMYGYWDSNTKSFIPVTVGASGIIKGTGTGGMRTERNNNPTAMTTDVAKSLGLVEGVDYVKGDPFTTESGATLYTAKLLGDPIATTIKGLDNAARSSSTHAFYTAGGAQRWTHTAMSDESWLSMSDDAKKQTILKMLQREGGDITKMAYYNEGQTGGQQDGGNYYRWNPMDDIFTEAYKNAGTKDERGALTFASTVYGNFYEMASDGSLDKFIRSGDFEKILAQVSQNKNFSSDDRGQGYLSAWTEAVKKANLQDENSQNMANIFTNMIELKLREESGAAISSSEWAGNFSRYVPQAGESEAVVRQKMMQWEKNVILKALGPSYKDSYKWIFSPESTYFTQKKGDTIGAELQDLQSYRGQRSSNIQTVGTTATRLGKRL